MDFPKISPGFPRPILGDGPTHICPVSIGGGVQEKASLGKYPWGGIGEKDVGAIPYLWGPGTPGRGLRGALRVRRRGRGCRRGPWRTWTWQSRRRKPPGTGRSPGGGGPAGKFRGSGRAVDPPGSRGSSHPGSFSSLRDTEGGGPRRTPPGPPTTHEGWRSRRRGVSWPDFGQGAGIPRQILEKPLEAPGGAPGASMGQGRGRKSRQGPSPIRRASKSCGKSPSKNTS